MYKVLIIHKSRRRGCDEAGGFLGFDDKGESVAQVIDYKRGQSDERPWGRWEVLDVGERHIVKRITVNPGHALSLQYHDHRHEHWVIVRGKAVVTLGKEKVNRGENEIVDIPAGTIHRVANEGSGILEFIEIQTGEVLSEDDITRLEDNYGRG
jgi:mannose-6-phosphate isomerase-like protein (cupin superfamily)